MICSGDAILGALGWAALHGATVVSGLLVPATMRLMGRRNWWAPPSLRRLVDRLGHAEAPAGIVAAED